MVRLGLVQFCRNARPSSMEQARKWRSVYGLLSEGWNDDVISTRKRPPPEWEKQSSDYYLSANDKELLAEVVEDMCRAGGTVACILWELDDLIEGLKE